MSVHVCPFCKCEKRRSRAKTRLDEESMDKAVEAANSLIKQYGSMRQAGLAYNDRFGLKGNAGEQLLGRVLKRRHSLSFYTLDRLETLRWS